MKDLRSWLENKAKLSSRALEAAIGCCEDNFIDTLEDLHVATKSRTEFQQIFPRGGIRARISTALGLNQEMSHEAKQPATEQPPDAVKSTAGDVPLPDGKTFAFFCSHK